MMTKGYVQRMRTPLGEWALVWSEKGLRKFAPRDADAEGEERRLEGFGEAVARYFAGKPERFDFRLDLSGLTEFERKALRAARGIGYGEVRSYGWVAERAGRPRAARAVGNAMAKNPLPIIIPCHRVIRSDGNPGGFSTRGGVETKRRLLALEGRG